MHPATVTNTYTSMDTHTMNVSNAVVVTIHINTMMNYATNNYTAI